MTSTVFEELLITYFEFSSIKILNFSSEKEEFIPNLNDEHDGYAWIKFGMWPKPLHNGLANTLRNKTNIQKLETVIKLVDLIV